MPEPQKIAPVIRAFRIRIAKRPERHDPAASPRKPPTLEERKRLRPIGRNNNRYQMMLDELRKLALPPTTRRAPSYPTRLMAPGQHWHQDGSPHHSHMLPVLQHQAIANGSTLHRVAIMAFWRSAMNRRVEAMSQERGHGRR